MSDKQKGFINAYLKGENARQAAIKAGYSAKTAHVTGYKLLQVPAVKEALMEKATQSKARNGVTVDRVIKEFERLALLNPQDFFASDGSLKPIGALSEESARAISGYKNGKFGPEIRFEHKLEALNGLAKYLGLWQEQAQQGQQLQINIHMQPKTSNELASAAIDVTPPPSNDADTDGESD